MLDLVLQGLLELAALPAERVWDRVRPAATRRSGMARAFVYTVGGTAVVLIYLVALAVLVAAFYAVAYAVT